MSESHDSQFEKKHPQGHDEQAQGAHPQEPTPVPNDLFKAQLKQLNNAHIEVPPELDEKIRAAAEEKWGSIDPPKLWFGKWIMPLTSAAVIGICVLLYSQNLFNSAQNENPDTVAMNDNTRGIEPMRPNAPADSQSFAAGAAPESASADKDLSKTGKSFELSRDSVKQQQPNMESETREDSSLLSLSAKNKKGADAKEAPNLADKFGIASKSARSRNLREIAEDIDQSGRVDILDAFHLAKVLELKKQSPDTKLPTRWDFNNDGQWNDADVNHLATHAVRIKPPQKGGAG